MKSLAYSLAASALLVFMVGCGGSSSDLPDAVLTDEAVAIQWIDFEKIDADASVRLFNGLSDDMDEDDRPRTRMLLSSIADEIDFDMRNKLESIEEAGVRGMLIVHYRESDTEDDVTIFDRQTHVYILADESAETDGLESAVAEMTGSNSDDMKLKEIDDAAGWYWLTEKNRDDDSLDMPDDGDEESAAVFHDLLDEAGNSPVVVAWRRTDVTDDQLKEQLDDDSLDDSQKELLESLQAVDSLVMTMTSGTSPSLSLTINFNEDETAQWYAEEANNRINARRSGFKRRFARTGAADNADALPTVDEINDLMDGLEYDVRGPVVSLDVGSDAIQSMLVLDALDTVSGSSSNIGSVLDTQLNEMGGASLGIPGGVGGDSFGGIDF